MMAVFLSADDKRTQSGCHLYTWTGSTICPCFSGRACSTICAATGSNFNPRFPMLVSNISFFNWLWAADLASCNLGHTHANVWWSLAPALCSGAGRDGILPAPHVPDILAQDKGQCCQSWFSTTFCIQRPCTAEHQYYIFISINSIKIST